MTYLCLTMASAGLTAALVLNWRAFVPLAALLFLASALAAAIWRDPKILLQGVAAYATAQIGYVVGGIASSTWHARRAARRTRLQRGSGQRSG